MNYTDSQLKQALAKMLPDSIQWRDDWIVPALQNIENGRAPIRDTELLHLCWLIEDTLKGIERRYYAELLHPEVKWNALESDFQVAHATWQQRTIALAKVKGVEIV